MSYKLVRSTTLKRVQNDEQPFVFILKPHYRSFQIQWLKSLKLKISICSFNLYERRFKKFYHFNEMKERSASVLIFKIRGKNWFLILDANPEMSRFEFSSFLFKSTSINVILHFLDFGGLLHFFLLFKMVLDFFSQLFLDFFSQFSIGFGLLV